MEPAPADPSASIVCRVTPWYFKRRAMMAGMFFFFGAYFLYDGKIGYPKQVEIAEKKEWFDKEFLGSFDTAKKNNALDQWISDAKAKGMPTGVDGEPPKWVTYAATQGWPEEPHHYTEREIAEQFYFGYGCLAAAAVVGIIVLLRKNTVLRGEADHFVTPDGAEVAFADVFRIDKRKWDKQGLAYAWYKPGGEGKERRAVIDDLMYDGAGRVLDRLLGRFNGELIEKVSEPEPAADATGGGDTPVEKPVGDS